MNSRHKVDFLKTPNRRTFFSFALFFSLICTQQAIGQTDWRSLQIRPPFLVTCEQLTALLRTGNQPESHLSQNFQDCAAKDPKTTLSIPPNELSIRLSDVYKSIESQSNGFRGLNRHEIQDIHSRFHRSITEASALTYRSVAKQFTNRTTTSILPSPAPIDASDRIARFVLFMHIFGASPTLVNDLYAKGFAGVQAIDAMELKQKDVRIFTCLDFGSMLTNWTMDEAVQLEGLFQECYNNPSTVLLIEGSKIDALIATVGNPLRKTPFLDDVQNRILKQGSQSSLQKLADANSEKRLREAAEAKAVRAEESRRKLEEQKARDIQAAQERKRIESEKLKAEEERERQWWESLSEKERQAILKSRQDQQCDAYKAFYDGAVLREDSMRAAVLSRMMVRAGCRF